MDIPSPMCVQYLQLTDVNGFVSHPGHRYVVNGDGEIEWRKSRSISSYILTDVDKLSNYLSFQDRVSNATGKPLFGCSKGVVERQAGTRVVCSLIPPLI
eukprot:6176732-Pleurochrysis_carterae.AAC.1